MATGDDTTPTSQPENPRDEVRELHNRRAAPAEFSNEPGTREELRQLLERVGLGRNQTDRWLDSPAALLSGLVPSLAITDRATAARARRATSRLIARLGDPVPDGARVVAVHIVEPGAFRIEMRFEWADGEARRSMDLEPYLHASRAHGPLLTDYARFCRLSATGDAVSWPGGLTLPSDLLFRESWPAAEDSERDTT